MIRKLATAAIAFAISGTAFAHGVRHHGYHHHHYQHRNHWVAPAVAGLIIGSAVAQWSRPTVITEPVVISSPPVANTLPPRAIESSCLVSIQNPYTGIQETIVVNCTRIQ